MRATSADTGEPPTGLGSRDRPASMRIQQYAAKYSNGSVTSRVQECSVETARPWFGLLRRQCCPFASRGYGFSESRRLDS